MSMSALSFLQNVQNAQNTAQSLAALQAIMKQDAQKPSSPLSPSSLVAATLPPDATNLYASLFNTATASSMSMNMLSPQMFAANSTAALLAARLNSSANFYPHSLFPWQLSAMGNSPPISPRSPALSAKSIKKINSNNNIVTTSTDDGNNYELNLDNIGETDLDSNKSSTKKIRKNASFKKKRSNHMLYQPYNNLETSPITGHTVSPGPISPPTSGSSPQSIGSMEHQSPSSTSIRSTPNKEPTRDKSFTCQTCNRSFGYKHVLQNHERTHTGEKPFACPECDKRFTRDHHLKTHMRLHTGEKPYHCKFCDKQFVQVANLRRHLRVHTGEKPYACEQCNCKYSDSNQLKAHMIIHKDEKPYRCETCSASFRRQHHLVNHKCSNAPLTPATSPVISLENKSITSRSEASERSLDLSTQNAAFLKHFKLNAAQQTQTLQQIYESTLSTIIENSGHEMPLDLSVESNSECSEKRNTRKSNDPRHILRMPKEEDDETIETPPTSEQIEPEDLSMHSPRSESPLLSEEDLDDLDDAEALNRKQSLQKISNC